VVPLFVWKNTTKSLRKYVITALRSAGENFFAISSDRNSFRKV
jgi:hypothetical protein